MGKSCWSCKHCINDYFATGTMDCKLIDDGKMTEEEIDDYYTKTEIDAMLSAIDPGIVDRINPGTTTQQGFFNIETEVENA